ncbi:MAG TPA: amidohydrolase family protein [Patescibacteria group bacterium]|nr:amidohydrolase family protein [Patescibacteria group bacterium]
MKYRTVFGLMLALLTALGAPAAGWTAAEATSRDLSAARKLFEANLDAIRRRDRAAYLACYLDSESMARTGPEGFQLGFKAHAAQSTETGWPDRFEAQDLRLVEVRPGFVYGTYRYRVSYGIDEHTGLSERIFVETPTGWRIAMTSAFDAPPGTPAPPRALVGATLIDGTGAPAVRDAVVILRGGKIDCAGRRDVCPVPEGIGVMDLKGLYLVPGLIDSHVHFSQTGWADGRPDSIDLRAGHPYEKVEAGLRAHPERFYRSYLCSGVTAVFDVGGYPWTWDLRSRAEADSFAPHVAAAGPLLSTLDHWLNLPAERQFIYLKDEATAREGVRYLASHGASAVKVWLITPPDRKIEDLSPLVAAAGEEARRLKLRVIVHATGLAEAKTALRAGASMLVHSVWDQPVDEEFITLAKSQGTIYCPTLTVIDGYARMYASASKGTPPVVDDPQGCVDTETLDHLAETARLEASASDRKSWEGRSARAEERHRIMAANLKRVLDAGIPVAMGTDAGNPLTLHGVSVFAEMEAMQAAGLTPMEVLVASTRNAARAMGRGDDLGTIEPGRAADLLVVGADPLASIANLRQTRFVARGGVVRPIEELRAARK